MVRWNIDYIPNAKSYTRNHRIFSFKLFVKTRNFICNEKQRSYLDLSKSLGRSNFSCTCNIFPFCTMTQAGWSDPVSSNTFLPLYTSIINFYQYFYSFTEYCFSICYFFVSPQAKCFDWNSTNVILLFIFEQHLFNNHLS